MVGVRAENGPGERSLKHFVEMRGGVGESKGRGWPMLVYMHEAAVVAVAEQQYSYNAMKCPVLPRTEQVTTVLASVLSSRVSRAVHQKS